MEIELFALADYAADQAGKLTIVGIFDTILGGVSPVVHPRCTVAIKLRFEKMEEGTKHLRLTLTDADGQLALPSIEIPMEVQMADDQHTITRQVVANFDNLKFEEFGEYSFDLAVDEMHEASIPLFVRQMNV
jgi:hypothetical protein